LKVKTLCDIDLRKEEIPPCVYKIKIIDTMKKWNAKKLTISVSRGLVA
jgi:hypothetical protein